jgi:hypothetical protein
MCAVAWRFTLVIEWMNYKKQSEKVCSVLPDSLDLPTFPIFATP